VTIFLAVQTINVPKDVALSCRTFAATVQTIVHLITASLLPVPMVLVLSWPNVILVSTQAGVTVGVWSILRENVFILLSII
jgi:hypothetical protein